MMGEIVSSVAGAGRAVQSSRPCHARLSHLCTAIHSKLAGLAACSLLQVMTFVLVSVVLETAINKKSLARAQAPLAIGTPCDARQQRRQWGT
jgi:hypothetical protein